jgi:CheY-like chemotaxis protein
MKIVIVDNTVLVQKIFVTLLKHILPKNEIIAFKGGQQAIEFFSDYFMQGSEEKIILFQDIHMPPPNGVDVIKFIRAEEDSRKGNEEIYIIASSAYLDKETIIPSIKSGSDAFFRKQVSMENLKIELLKVEFWDKSKVVIES